MINPQVYLNKNVLSSKVKKAATRDGFGEGMVELGDSNNDVLLLTADLRDSTKSAKFAKKYPKRFMDVGVAEQNLMGIGVGLALSGNIPFLASYATFSPGRNWEQVRLACLMNANVKIAGHHAGLVTGPDGATHQALEDIALTRVLPNMRVIVPCDREEARKATIAAAKLKGPVYLRFSRVKSAEVTSKKTPFEIGKAELIRFGEKVTIVACGHLVFDALRAAEEVDGEVIDMHTIKPMDVKTLLNSVKKTGKVVTVEDHQTSGGLGGAVAEVLGEHFPVPMRRVGVNDRFGKSGEAEELLKSFSLTWEDIGNACEEII